jgi:extradiol dioxygenase family protein
VDHPATRKVPALHIASIVVHGSHAWRLRCEGDGVHALFQHAASWMLPLAFAHAMPNLPPFHLAFPVTSLASARAFYGDLLGCPEGRSSDSWVDFDFHGHQIVAHLAPEAARLAEAHDVDGDAVPVRHFGVVLSMADWQALADKLREAGTHFVVEPHVRFRGQPGEQATMFLLDPSGNALEFKAFADRSRLIAR